MEKSDIKFKALYFPKGAAFEYGTVGCNFYNGCTHGCEYCYLKRGVLSKALGKSEVTLKKHFKDEGDALEKFKYDCDTYTDYLKKTGIFFSFSTDPFIKETYLLTAEAVKYAASKGIYSKVLTKNGDFDLLQWAAVDMVPQELRYYVAYGFTLTGVDSYEGNAPRNVHRIETMARLKEKGFRTFASIEPIVYTDDSLRMVKLAVNVCDHFKIGLQSGVKKDYYDLDSILTFIVNVMSYTNGKSTVYWKESVRKFIGSTLDLDKWYNSVNQYYF